MKTNNLFVAFLLAVVLIAGIGIGRVYATTGCFTDTIGNPFETYICWMKDNGITSGIGGGLYGPDMPVSRGQMAAFMYRVSNVPPSIGDTHINQSLSSILPNANYPNARIEYYSDTNLLRASAAGLDYYMVDLTFPTSMYGRATYWKGAQICYNATYANAALTNVLVSYWVNTAGDVTNPISAVDNTTRTDKTCRTYLFASPILMSANNHGIILLGVTFATSGGQVGINSVTAILSPSTSAGTFDAIPAQEPALFQDQYPTGTTSTGQ